jgi:hypothetical protein
MTHVAQQLKRIRWLTEHQLNKQDHHRKHCIKLKKGSEMFFNVLVWFSLHETISQLAGMAAWR